MKDFNEAFNDFFDGVCDIYWNHYADMAIPAEALSYKEGRRYMKLVCLNSEGKPASVFCFVDKETGEVLKAAGWNAPAKGSRGNIFDQYNGLRRITPYGAAYNR